MKVTIKHPLEVIIHELRVLTLKQFIETNNAQPVFTWVDGYLINFSHVEGETFDKGILNGTWNYRGVDVAPLPDFTKELQGRHSKIQVFDSTGVPIIEAIIKEVKKNCSS